MVADTSGDAMTGESQNRERLKAAWEIALDYLYEVECSLGVRFQWNSLAERLRNAGFDDVIGVVFEQLRSSGIGSVETEECRRRVEDSYQYQVTTTTAPPEPWISNGIIDPWKLEQEQLQLGKGKPKGRKKSGNGGAGGGKRRGRKRNQDAVTVRRIYNQQYEPWCANERPPKRPTVEGFITWAESEDDVFLPTTDIKKIRKLLDTCREVET
jgi:hypothetical protein